MFEAFDPRVDVTIDPVGSMGRYDVVITPMDESLTFDPIQMSVDTMKGVLQFISDTLGEQGMVGEPEAQTELPLGKGGLAREHKVRITKSQLQKIIKEELGEEAESRYPERGSQDEAQYEVMVQMGKFLARLFNEGHNELADEFSQILDQADKAGMRGRMGW